MNSNRPTSDRETTTRLLVPVLQVSTLVALAAAAALLVWPVNVHVTPLDPTLPALAVQAPVPVSPTTALTDSIVNSNIFSLAREAPDARTFAAAPTDSVIAEISASEYGADAGISDDGDSIGTDRVPVLHGVIDGPTGRAALLRLDATIAAARLFRLGEGAGGYRVRSIGADRVELSGPTGPLVLQLAAKGDTP